MKVIVTQKQLENIRENTTKIFSCEKCDYSWKIEKEDKFPYLCHMCGYDSAKEKHNYDELENFWKNYKKEEEEEEITEKWSEKYKKSIDCNNPEGFSQKAHCQGRKKKELDEYSRTLKMARRQGSGLRFPKSAIKTNPSRFREYNRLQESKLIDGKYDLDKIKKSLKILSQLSTTFGEFIPLDFKLYGYEMNRRGFGIMILFIDIDSEEGVYDPPSGILYEIGQQLLEIFQMIGIRDEKRMFPLYDFKFNKRPLNNIETV